MPRRLALALCLVVMAACHDSTTASRSDAAVDHVGAALEVSPIHDSPPVSPDQSVSDAIVADLAEEVPGLDLPREETASDAEPDVDPRDAPATDARADTASDAPGSGDGSTGPDLAMDVLGSATDVAPDLAAVDTGLAGFCTGSAPRLATNGHTTGPAIRTSIEPTGCCDGIELEIITATFLYPIYVRWVVPAGAGPFPLEVDLSDPNAPSSFRVATECDSTRANCEDSYQAGFVGRLGLSQADAGYGYEASLCVHVEEPAASPHTSLHSFDLYLPRLVIR